MGFMQAYLTQRGKTAGMRAGAQLPGRPASSRGETLPIRAGKKETSFTAEAGPGPDWRSPAGTEAAYEPRSSAGAEDNLAGEGWQLPDELRKALGSNQMHAAPPQPPGTPAAIFVKC
jgi:hypothetical protein